MRNTILIALVCCIFFACKKDTYPVTPRLIYKSANTTQLGRDQILKMNLSFTAANGAILDTMYVQKVSLNCAGSNFSQKYLIPSSPNGKNAAADILISYSNGINNPGYVTVASACNFNDTCFFRFMIKDTANHRSDTVKSELIVIYK